MRNMTHGRALRSYNNTWQYLLQTMQHEHHTPRANNTGHPPPGMARVPAAKSYHFVTESVAIEDGIPRGSYGPDVQFPWEQAPQKTHRQLISVPSLLVDQTTVTCAAYGAYLNASGYSPQRSMHVPFDVPVLRFFFPHGHFYQVRFTGVFIHLYTYRKNIGSVVQVDAGVP